MKKHRSTALRGTVVAHNISPKGDVESALVETEDGVAQLNFSKHGAPELTRRMEIGAKVDAAVELEHDDGAHPVYRATVDTERVTGKVVRLNYARHGEVNGYHLDDATFVHVKPDGAKRYKLRVGDRITAHGPRRVGAATTVVEPHEVTKVQTRARR